MGTHTGSRRGLLRGAAAAVPGAWLAACAGVGGAERPAATTLPPTTIEYMHFAAAGGAQAQARDESATKFMAKAPAITVTVTAIAPSGTMLEKFKTAAAAGTPPDLLTLPTTWYGDLLASKMVAELDPLIKTRGQGFQRDAFYPDVLAVLELGGKLYGVPRFVVTSVLYYNKDLFARQGIASPTENWTWEKDFVETGQKLTRSGDGNQVFAMDFAPNDFRDSLIFAWGNDYFDGARKRSTLDDAKGLAALQFAYDHRWRTRILLAGCRAGDERAADVPQRANRDIRPGQLRVRQPPRGQDRLPAGRRADAEGAGGPAPVRLDDRLRHRRGVDEERGRLGVHEVAGGGRGAAAPGQHGVDHAGDEEGVPVPGSAAGDVEGVRRRHQDGGVLAVDSQVHRRDRGDQQGAERGAGERRPRDRRFDASRRRRRTPC